GWLPLVVYAQQPAKQAKAKNKAAEIRPPDEATSRVIEEKARRLNAALDQLRDQLGGQRRFAREVLPEVEIYAKAVEWVSRHNEWFGDTAKWAVAVLDDGLKRTEELAAANEAVWRKTAGKSVVRAYQSRIDGSVQPYAITAPLDFGKDRGKSWR